MTAALRIDGDAAEGLEPVLFGPGEGASAVRRRAVSRAAERRHGGVLGRVVTEISAPTLVLRASYGAGHAVELEWEWAYQVGETTQHAGLATGGDVPGIRDHVAERAVLDETVLTASGLERYGLLDDAGRPVAAAPVSLAGLDSMRLTTEELPRLAQHPGVSVEVIGQPAEYREVGETLSIGVSTMDVAGERDWYDLGVSVTVEGRELPFADVFAALAGGESQMLLADGAHFSLLAPRLQSLRQLIEEARALTESPSAALRISRYQAGLWPSSPRSASSPSRRRRGSGRSARCSSSTRSPNTNRRRR